MSRAAAVCVALLAVGLVAASERQASARIPIVANDDVAFSFAGAVRSISGWADLGAVSPGGQDLGLHTTIARAELRFSGWERVTVDVHSRVVWSTANLPILQSGFGLGAGASVTPGRWLDTRSVVIDEPLHRVEHDLDRAVVRLFLGDVDLSVGRQAITWGNGLMFPVADLWTTFSPFELDTDQKRGIDAIRAVWSASEAVELDFVVADRGRLEDLSGGVRATFFLGFGDVWVGAARLWEQAALMGGVSAQVDALTLRADVVAAYDVDEEAMQAPRITVGGEWYASGDLVVSAEAHYSGLAGDPEALGRGEIYLRDRWYASAAVQWRPWELVSIALTPMVDIEAPGALLAWSLGYQVSQNVDLSLGAYHGLGEGDFGQVKHFVHLQLAAYL